MSDDPRFAMLMNAARDELSPPLEPTQFNAPQSRSRPILPPPPRAEEAPAPPAEGDTEPAPPTAAATEADGNYGAKALALAGALLLVAGLGLGAQKYLWVRDCGTTGGEVIAASASDPNVPPLVKYTVANQHYYFPQPDADVGTKVVVRHRHDDPSDAVIWDPVAVYQWPGLIALVGVGALVVGMSALALRTGPDRAPARSLQ
jgi:hypothetical protein